ncbi:myrosinase 1-like isoform X1 [Bacillus rossius redtenbacheri]|uniref:myrosinase 1-like isoform X1 n=1 Tax=Bacillus rossius redtenbacheri TaxID=93214 RepID=UPI002FDEBD60
MRAPQLLLLLLAFGRSQAARNTTFPEGFLFGAATAAYQVEGAWNTSGQCLQPLPLWLMLQYRECIAGKGEHIWDRMVHTRPNCIADRTSGDVAADSYHKYKEDVKLLKDVGFNFYRFSISWARILPKGDVSVINKDGIDYYNNLINELLANNIQPVVTMYHWDLPQHLQDLGGLVGSAFGDYFEDYARVLYTNFGDRVKWWLTFNEPGTFVDGYTSHGCVPPAVDAPGVGDYLVAHSILKAHARAYRLYDREFRSEQKGNISIALSAGYGTPKTNSNADIEATETFMQHSLGWFAHPIYSQEGDYPAVMKERVANNSKAEGLFRSRLPEFGEYWVNYIRGTADFFGLNYYSSWVVSHVGSSLDRASRWSDMDVMSSQDPGWTVSVATWLAYTPFGMRGLLSWVSKNYNNTPILITENGWADTGEINDTMRAKYYVNNLAHLLDAIYLDNVTVLGHTAWSIIDNFEWAQGYTQRFGLHHIDFNDPQRPRTPKESARVFAALIKNRKLPENYLDKVIE